MCGVLQRTTRREVRVIQLLEFSCTPSEKLSEHFVQVVVCLNDQGGGGGTFALRDCNWLNRQNADARFRRLCDAYLVLLRKRLPAMMFSSVYTSLRSSAMFAMVALYALYGRGYENDSDPFEAMMTALALIQGFSGTVANVVDCVALAGPTFGIFQRIANGLSKLKDVQSTYQYFESRYE